MNIEVVMHKRNCGSYATRGVTFPPPPSPFPPEPRAFHRERFASAILPAARRRSLSDSRAKAHLVTPASDGNLCASLSNDSLSLSLSNRLSAAVNPRENVKSFGFNRKAVITL